VVIQNISDDYRRATRDLDLDFIRYSLEDGSIREFIRKLNNTKDGIDVKIVSDIKPLSHQDYDGKRVLIELKDTNGNKIRTKLDIGVHRHAEIKQEEYWFNFNSIEDSVKLLVNSKEQIFVEKLKSLLKFDFLSTRYKDIFDFYYLINMTDLNKNKLYKFIEFYIFSDPKTKEKNTQDIYVKLNGIFKNEIFMENLNNAKDNWLELSGQETTDNILGFFKSLETVSV